jgi:hypothetical protein
MVVLRTVTSILVVARERGNGCSLCSYYSAVSNKVRGNFSSACSYCSTLNNEVRGNCSYACSYSSTVSTIVEGKWLFCLQLLQYC